MKVHMKKLAAFMLAGALVLSGFGQTTVEAEESTPEEQGIEAVANEMRQPRLVTQHITHLQMRSQR